jgi:hypothetical protein
VLTRELIYSLRNFFYFIADIVATIITANSVNLFTKLSFNMVKKCGQRDRGIRNSFKKEYPRETGEIINDCQKIFGTTIRLIWKGSANISVY